jgi:hypothetical protein
MFYLITYYVIVFMLVTNCKVGTPATVINHGTHKRPHSRDTEGSMKDTFGQLAEIRPSSMLEVEKLITASH